MLQTMLANEKNPVLPVWVRVNYLEQKSSLHNGTDTHLPLRSANYKLLGANKPHSYENTSYSRPLYAGNGGVLNGGFLAFRWVQSSGLASLMYLYQWMLSIWRTVQTLTLVLCAKQ